MARSAWRGYLKISLVNIPIQVFPATESAAALSFNQLHAECQTRIQQRRWCPSCAREVLTADIVKGYEFERGRYVILDEEDFDAVRPDSTRVIDLVQFADAGELDPMYVDRTYYLAPQPVGAEAFAVMRDGMKGKIGVGKLALYGREYLVAVRPLERGLVLHTLHHAAEIRSIEALGEELAKVPAVVDAAQAKLARQLVQTFEAPLDLSTFSDAYVEGLRKVIDDKIAGREVVGPPAPEAPRVVNLAEALRQSLETLQRTKKAPAKASRTPRKRRSRTAA
jgi:DNA end-binding protein Ku